MNILFDLIAAQPVGKLKYHGGSEYAKAVFWAVVQKTQGRIFCLFDSALSLEEDIKSYCIKNGIPLIDINKYEKLNSVIDKYNIERFYTALPLEKSIQRKLPLTRNVKCIITIHGLRSLELTYDIYELKYTTGLYYKLKYFYKRLFPFKYETRLLFRIRQMIRNYNDPTIITVSGYSKSAIRYFIPEIPEKKIFEFYSPINDYLLDGDDRSFLLTHTLESKKYFLLLSASIWQKNSYRVLSVIKSLIKEGHLNGSKFVIIGASVQIKNNFRNASFIYLDYLDRSDLEILLKHAHALIYPSLNEGFGYPPLEAFKYGTGVIASSIAPIMEICGNAALFFNPYSFTEMKLRLLQLVSDPSFISDTQKRIDQFHLIRQRQISDLDSLVQLICD